MEAGKRQKNWLRYYNSFSRKDFQITRLLDDQIIFINDFVEIIWLGMAVNNVQQIQRHGRLLNSKLGIIGNCVQRYNNHESPKCLHDAEI
jgi:hypothetical protein